MMFEGIKGQQKAKKQLEFYKKAYDLEKSIPPLLLVSEKGNGKTELARRFSLGLKKKAYEINCASLKGLDDFFEMVDSKGLTASCTVIFDECSEIPKKIQMFLLSIVQPSKKNINSVTYKGEIYKFDLRKTTFIFATTEMNKLFHALIDRLEVINLERFKERELLSIISDSLKGESIKISRNIEKSLVSIMRGNARDAIKLAENIKLHSFQNGYNIVGREEFSDFLSVKSIYAYGVNEIEKDIILSLKERGSMTLTNLASILSMTTTSLRNCYELYLMKKGLMKIGSQSKRVLTRKGILAAGKILKKDIQNV